VLRAHAARIEDVDRIARARLASYIGCTVEEIISLEARGATISGCEALELGLVNRLVGAPILSQRAADARVERLIAGTRPARFTAADVARMAAAGINGRPIGIAKPALRDLLNDRARR
jgi:enoyl-CoA hydratase/carnithine racemase